MIGVFCHFPVFRRIGVTCAKSNHDRHRTHLGPIFLVLLKRSFDGVLGAPLRTTVLKIGVPRGINLPWKDHPPAGRGPGSSKNMAPRTVWRERWLKYSAKSGSIASWAYRDSIFYIGRLPYEKPGKREKRQSRRWRVFRFCPLNRYVPLVKGPKKAVS